MLVEYLLLHTASKNVLYVGCESSGYESSGYESSGCDTVGCDVAASQNPSLYISFYKTLAKTRDILERYFMISLTVDFKRESLIWYRL